MRLLREVLMLTFSPDVQVGNMLTSTSQISIDQTETYKNIKGQMVVCYENIKNILKEFNASLDNVMDEIWFVTDVEDCMKNVAEIFAERERIYGCKPEVSQTLVGTSGLVQPNLKIEIKCIAYVD